LAERLLPSRSVVENARANGRYLHLSPDEVEAIRSLLIEADAFVSHMVYRGSWPEARVSVERLIGKLRQEDGRG
jgi:hypothetical protein